MFVQKHRLMEEAGEGKEGSSGDAPALDLSNPAVKELVDKAVEAATSTFKKAQDELLNEKRDLQRQLKSFEGIDIQKIQDMQKRLENDEEASLISEGKLDEVISRRTERMRTDMTQRIEALAENETTLKDERDGYKRMFENERINNSVRAAAEKSGVRPEAIDDVINRSAGVFSLSEEGDIVARDKAGSLMLSKDGKTVLGPAEFVESLKESAPYYWPESTGVGSSGAGAGRGATTDVSARMQAAVARGDMKEYRRLREEMKKAG